MSLAEAVSRIQQIQQMIKPPAAQQPATDQTGGAQFAGELQSNMNAGNTSAASGSVANKMVTLARTELAKGVKETNGNNDSSAIARYRTATKGAAAGQPWCAYFVSYIARQAGAPIGAGGSGLGYVPDITAWARSTGKFIPASGQPKAGDVILFPQHIGIVESVNKDGSLNTIEGNHSDKVDRVHRNRSEAVGFLRLS